jgi:hypothetical protein
MTPSSSLKALSTLRSCLGCLGVAVVLLVSGWGGLRLWSAREKQRALAPLPEGWYSRFPGWPVTRYSPVPWRIVVGVITSSEEEERNRQLAQEWFGGKVTLLKVLIVNQDRQTFRFHTNLRPPGRRCLGVRLRRPSKSAVNRFDAEWLDLVQDIIDPAVRQQFAIEQPIVVPPHSQRTCLFGFAERFRYTELVSVTFDVEDVFGLVLEPKEHQR